MKKTVLFLMLIITIITIADSLWQASDQLPIFSTKRVYRVGDIITVIVSETPSLSLSDNNPDYQKGVLGAINSLFNVIGNVDIGKFFPLNMNSPQNVSVSNKSKSSSSKANVSLYITVKVTEVLPDGNLKVYGEKEIKVDNERKMMYFTGIVAPQKVKNGTIYSYEVADSKIWFQGDKDFKKSPEEKSWVSWIFSLIANLFF